MSARVDTLRREAMLYAITDPERAYEILQQIKAEERRTGEICICGHSIKSHVDSGNGTAPCFPGRMRCDCKNPRAVIRASNARYFLKRTDGPSSWHALGAGILNAEKNGSTIEWIEPQGKVCDRCGSDDMVIPVALNPKTGIVESHTTGIDKLVCRTCYNVLGVSAGLS